VQDVQQVVTESLAAAAAALEGVRMDARPVAAIA